MKTRKQCLILAEKEWRIVLIALNRLRSKLVAQGRYFISDSKLLLSSLVPWVALLPSNSQAEGMLVKNHRNYWNGSSFYDII